MIDLRLGDCLELMKTIPSGSVDAILTDLPYGTTACSWDVIIPFEPMWSQVKRVLKPRGVFVTTASQPFTSKLVMSNLEWFKYEWIWDKVQPTGQMSVEYMPMKQHENVVVFSDGASVYNRQFAKRPVVDLRINAVRNKNNQTNTTSHAHLGGADNRYSSDYNQALVNPMSIVRFSRQPTRDALPHPTQKPVALYAYLIRTYTNEGDTVLDMCMGSGTTIVACVQTGRNGIGIELREDYYQIAERRVAEAQLQVRMAI
jgi:site-specific DNA-methyltransferase (adenine-specific)